MSATVGSGRACARHAIRATESVKISVFKFSSSCRLGMLVREHDFADAIRPLIPQRDVRASSMRRFTRLTNGFSKELDNLKAAVALHFAHYNMVRVHRILRVTPAVAAGVESRL